MIKLLAVFAALIAVPATALAGPSQGLVDEPGPNGSLKVETSLVEASSRVRAGEHLILPLAERADQATDDGRLLCRLSVEISNERRAPEASGGISMNVGMRTCIQVLIDRHADGSISANYLTLVRSGEISVPVGDKVQLDLVNFAQASHVGDVPAADIYMDLETPGVAAAVGDRTSLLRTTAGEAELGLTVDHGPFYMPRSTAVVEARRSGWWAGPTGDVSVEVVDEGSGSPVLRRDVPIRTDSTESVNVDLAGVPAGDYEIMVASENFNGPSRVRHLHKEPQGPWIWLIAGGGALIVIAMARRRWWWRSGIAGSAVLAALVLGVLGRGGVVVITPLADDEQVVLETESGPADPERFPPTSIDARIDAVSRALADQGGLGSFILDERRSDRVSVLGSDGAPGGAVVRTRSVSYATDGDRLTAEVTPR